MIDLHIHSNFSDGTDSVEQLIDNIIEKGIKYFSITDHDTIGGVNYLLGNKTLLKKLEDNNIHFVKGVEFSSIINGNKIHLLAYDFNENSDFLNVLQIGQEKRLQKFDMRINALKEQFGIEYSETSLKELRDKCDFVGKPIMARFMQKDGICDDYELCFKKYLNELKVPSFETRVDANIVISGIVASSGKCVWAHPYGGNGEDKISIEKVEEILNMLIPLGLKGIECYYNLYTEKEIADLVALANKYGLKISSGSDYHGENKKVKLGQLCVEKNIVVDKSMITIFDEF